MKEQQTNNKRPIVASTSINIVLGGDEHWVLS